MTSDSEVKHSKVGATTHHLAAIVGMLMTDGKDFTTDRLITPEKQISHGFDYVNLATESMII